MRGVLTVVNLAVWGLLLLLSAPAGVDDREAMDAPAALSEGRR